MSLERDQEGAPLLVIAGPTASGKSALAMRVAEALAPQVGAEIVSCDSVAVYRGLDIGSAKPSGADRARVPHHGLDLFDPDQPCTAGDYARHARAALAGIRGRGHLAVVVGGTGLYLRALLEGLAPAPPRDERLRERLRERAARQGVGRRTGSLHRLLGRLDPRAAALIHPNDTPKLIRSLEVTLTARAPQSEQWDTGREPLQGFRIVSFVLDPPRAALYSRINERAAGMFAAGLVEETRGLLQRYGNQPPLRSLGYAQAGALLCGELPLPEAMAAAQQGHRNYAKRQLTWFRNQLSRKGRSPGARGYHRTTSDNGCLQPDAAETLPRFGDDPEALSTVLARLQSEWPNFF